jgi:hypothetical protein
MEIKIWTTLINIPEEITAPPFNYHHVASSFVTDRHKVKVLQEYFLYEIYGMNNSYWYPNYIIHKHFIPIFVTAVYTTF